MPRGGSSDGAVTMDSGVDGGSDGGASSCATVPTPAFSIAAGSNFACAALEDGLFEEAFKELGLKKSNFHSIMIAALDNILAAPDVQGDILLVRPKVFYQFADPALEKMPQTHKLMLRMGPENARSVKASLRQLRAKLITQ
jgi:hypothetical protein